MARFHSKGLNCLKRIILDGKGAVIVSSATNLYSGQWVKVGMFLLCLRGFQLGAAHQRWHPFVSTFIILFSSLACLRVLLAIAYLLESIPSLLKLWNGSSFNLCNIIVDSVKALNPQNRNKSIILRLTYYGLFAVLEVRIRCLFHLAGSSIWEINPFFLNKFIYY